MIGIDVFDCNGNLDQHQQMEAIIHELMWKQHSSPFDPHW
jgi:hypothetical protein